MRPVRIVTLVAVSVGGAMGAGWMFQPDAGPQTAQLATETPHLASAAPAGPSALTSLLAEADTEIAAAPPEVAPEVETGVDIPADIPSVAALTEIIPQDDAAPPPVFGPVATASADDGFEPCMTALVVTSEAAAMLDMTLYAPCQAGEAITVSHGPLRLPATLDRSGQVAMVLPALAPQAEVGVTFADGSTEADLTDVPDFGQFARLVLQWDGAPVVDLHAYVGGADWGDEGHVHAGSPILASAGFVTAFQAEAGAQALVFTYPAGRGPGDAAVQLEAEVAVTEASCGRPFEARVYTIRAEAPVGQRALRVDMPPCDGAGGFVLLQDILPEGGPSVAALN